MLCILFEIHGSKLKLHPIADLSEASVWRITHCVFFFCVRKDTLNSFLAFVIDVLVFRCVPDILCLLNIIGPDMPRYGFYTVFRMGTQLACRTVFAGLRIAFVFPVTVAVGGTVFQDTVLRTDNAIIIFVVYKFPPFIVIGLL